MINGPGPTRPLTRSICLTKKKGTEVLSVHTDDVRSHAFGFPARTSSAGRGGGQGRVSEAPDLGRPSAQNLDRQTSAIWMSGRVRMRALFWICRGAWSERCHS